MRNNKKRGFTLVELLVVIAILAILATVSVVGYTSFITRASVSNDENVAAQLNKFMVALKADHTGDFYGEEIDETNIREVTALILKDSGLNELVPQSLDYGYNFYYDLETGEYVVMEDKKILNAGIHYLIDAFADEPSAYEVKLENCFTQGNRYFFVGTPSDNSRLAQIINGFYNLDSDTDVKTLLDLASNFDSKLYAFVSNAVVVTDNCNYRISNTPTFVIFADGVKSVGTTTKQWNDGTWGESFTADSLATLTAPLTIPDSVKYMAGNSLNVGSTATIVFKKNASDLGNMAFQHFTDATIKTNDGTYHSDTCTCGNTDHTGKDVIVSDANATVDVLLNFYNPAVSFGAKVEDVKDKVLNHNNYAYVVYDNKTFDLNALNFVGQNSDLPSSTMNSDVVWTLENGSHTYVKSITTDGVVTLADTAPTTACDITFTATTPEGVKTSFVLKVVAANGVTFSFDGVDMTTRDSISLFYGKSEDSTDTFSLTNDVVKYNYPENEIVGLDLADDITFADYDAFFTADGKTLSVKTNDASGKLAIKVNVGEYYSKTINVDLMNVNALNFLEKYENTPYVDNDRVFYVGDDNVVLLGDLFNKNKDYPVGTQVWVTNDMPEADYSTMTGITQSTLLTTAKIDLDSAWNETEIQFTSNGDVAIVVVVAPDAKGNYYRISEPVRVNVVDGTNVRNWKELAGTEAATAVSKTTSIVMLGDITMPSATTPTARFALTGATLYGNCFTFDIKNGVKQNYFGIIQLTDSKMQDTRVIGDLYPTVAIQAPDLYGTNAVYATGTTTIENCYIANCRATLASGSEDNNATDVITVKNSVLFGGRYANIDLRGGTLKFEGEVIAINQPHTDSANADNVAVADRIAGFGIAVWLEAPTGTNIHNIDKLTQYNFIPETYNDIPAVSLSASGITVSADCNDLFEDIFTEQVGVGDCTKTDKYHYHITGCTYASYEYKYGDYHFTRGTTKYINPGVLGEDIGDAVSGLTSLIGMTLPSGDRTGYNKTAPSNYQYTSMEVATNYSVIKVTVHTYGILGTQTDLFAASENAEFIFSPWSQTAGGTPYGAYGFTNGVIIPQ